METRLLAWIRPEEQQAMEVDSPMANLKRLLEAKAAKEAKNNSKKTKNIKELTERTNNPIQGDHDDMEIEETDAGWYRQTRSKT